MLKRIKWKIVKDVFMYDSQLKTNDIHVWEIEIGMPIYNCYRRLWGIFWVLKRQMTQREYDNLVNRIHQDGYDFDSMYKRINF